MTKAERRNVIRRLARGGFILPSPAEVDAALTPRGAWTAATLANWGIAWPPRKGWRRRLEKRWYAKQAATGAAPGNAPGTTTAATRLGDAP